MELSKTKNTIKGLISGIFNKLVSLLGPFALRTLIIYYMGINYVGLNGLFSSILTVLSLTELGFGSALVFSMYQPISENNKEKICALLNLYKKVYLIIGVAVLVLGCLVLPFLPMLIKDDSIPGDLNVYYLYLIYLLNSVLSYLILAYDSSLFSAFQRTDVISNIQTSVYLVQYVLQALIIIFLKNYYYYAIMVPIATALINLIVAFFAKKNYPEYKPYGFLSKDELKAIKKQVVGLLFQRLAQASRNAFDSIIISAYVGLTAVGIYNNYFLILNALTGVLNVFWTSMQSGIGNSLILHSKQKNYEDMLKINFLYMWISGWFSICFCILAQTFMKLWVGENLLLPFYTVVLMSIYFYGMKATDTTTTYINSSGIWWICKYYYLVEALINLILNILLGYFWGILGVVLATIISILFDIISCSILLFKHYFTNEKVSLFFLRNIFYFAITVVGEILSFFSCSWINFGTEKISYLLEFLAKFGFCLMIPNILYLLSYFKYDQFIVSKKWLASKIKSKKQRK